MPNDYVLDYMKKKNIPQTRKNYLDIAYLGDPPDELSAEEEAAIPAHLPKPLQVAQPGKDLDKRKLF